MIFLGLFFGILVTAYLPGHFFVERSKLSIPLFSKLILSMLLSLMMMFQISFIATVSGAMWLYWVYFYLVLLNACIHLRKTKLESFFSKIRNAWAETAASPFSLGLFLIVLLFLAANFHRFNGMFVQWDAIVSWNRWALDWFHGVFPRGTYHYPQLIPAAWASIYRFSQHDYQFFVVFLIPTLVFVHLFSIGESAKESKGSALLHFGILFLWINHFFNIYLFDGYVDIVLIVEAGASLLFLQKAYASLRKEPSPDVEKLALFSVLIACVAALTKQGGFLILIYALFEAFLIQRQLPKKNRFFYLAVMATFTFALPYYLYIQYQIQLGNIQSEVAYITQDIYQGKTPWERLVAATFGMKITALLFLANGVWFFFFQGWKKRLAAFTFILYLIWGMFFCYDYRNLAVGFATCAFTYGVLFGDLVLSKTNQFIQYARRKKIYEHSVLWIFLPILIMLFFVNRNNPLDRLEYHSRRLKIKTYANPELAYFLYHGWDTRCERVYTNWEYVSYLPDFEKKATWINTKDDTPEVRSQLERAFTQAGTHCFILPTPLVGSLENVLQETVQKHHLKQVLESEGRRFFESEHGAK